MWFNFSSMHNLTEPDNCEGSGTEKYLSWCFFFAYFVISVLVLDVLCHESHWVDSLLQMGLLLQLTGIAETTVISGKDKALDTDVFWAKHLAQTWRSSRCCSRRPVCRGWTGPAGGCGREPAEEQSSEEHPDPGARVWNENENCLERFTLAQVSFGFASFSLETSSSVYLKPPPSYCAWLRSLLTLFLSSRVSGNTMLKPALTSADGWSSVGGAEGGRSINRYLGRKSIKAFLTQGAILWVAGVRKFTFNTPEHGIV